MKLVTPTNGMWQLKRQSQYITRVKNYSLLLKVTKIQEKLSHKQMKVSFYSNMTHGHEQSAFPL